MRSISNNQTQKDKNTEKGKVVEVKIKVEEMPDAQKDDQKEKIDELTEEARVAQDEFDNFGDQKNKDTADAKNQEIVDLVAIYNTLDALVQGYETQLTQTEIDRKANKNRKLQKYEIKKIKKLKK